MVVLSVITLKLLPTYFFAHRFFAFVPVAGRSTEITRSSTKEKKKWMWRMEDKNKKKKITIQKEKRLKKFALQYCYTKIKWHHFSSASGEIVCSFFRKLLVWFKALYGVCVFFSCHCLFLFLTMHRLVFNMWPKQQFHQLCDLVFSSVGVSIFSHWNGFVSLSLSLPPS